MWCVREGDLGALCIWILELNGKKTVVVWEDPRMKERERMWLL